MKNEIALRVRKLRTTQHMSRQALGSKVFMSYGSIARLESGERSLTLEEAVKFAAVLGVSLNDLAGVL